MVRPSTSSGVTTGRPSSAASALAVLVLPEVDCPSITMRSAIGTGAVPGGVPSAASPIV
jgi:hypothetical protein